MCATNLDDVCEFIRLSAQRASQLASEQAPLLSLSFGWAGKDQRLSF